METDRFERFTLMLSNASKSLHRLKSKFMAMYGLASTHTMCMRKLYENPEGLTKREISDDCDIDKAQITRIVDQLIEKGFVISDESKKAYNRKFFLTQKGKEVTDKINGMVIEINRYVSGEIPTEDIEVFYSVFETINNNLKEAENYFIERFSK